jgi:hypothetical protein
MLSFSPLGLASMSITATPTTITISTSPNLPGSVSGHSWTAFVGPVRSRDKNIITAQPTYGWAGMSCQGTIKPCPSRSWVQIEQAWVTYFGSVTTSQRTDADWQPGDQICEGTAYIASVQNPWYPPPEYISIPGPCVALPDPRPVSCVLSVPEIAHGQIAAPDVGGNTATATASLTCTASTSVTIRAVASEANPSSTVPVRPDSSITSHLTINGIDGATGVGVAVVANQPKTVTLGSTLASAAPTVGVLQGNAALIVDTLATKPIGITGNVVAPLGPKAVLKMVELTGNAQSNLGIRWSWSTTPADYGGSLVPANYLVGFFVRDATSGKWSAFRVDGSFSGEGTWAARIQAFHDKNDQGGIDEPASRVFEAGTWCITTAAASTRETGGSFIPAPGAAESCVTIR